MKKNRKSKSIILLIIGVFFIVTSVSAAVTIAANNVSYSNSNLSGADVQAAIDNIYSKCEASTTTCPSGLTCTKKTNIKCKRATTLHTETCTNSNTSLYCQGAGYSSGATITYGNETITEGVLTTGDAFDCDVNGDGTYDSATERFYFVSNYYDTSNQNFNDKVAVLIYYSNVLEGVANTAGTAYDNYNYYGPVTAREQLPTTTQWSNVSLYKESRRILGKNNETKAKDNDLPTKFSYAGYAARLLTYQEVYNGCNSYNILPDSDGWLDIKCLFLMEGTTFSNSSLSTSGSLLETAQAGNIYQFYRVAASYRTLGTYSILRYETIGARPTIEVLKSEISY